MNMRELWPSAPRRHAVSRRILDGLIGLFLVALTGCGGGTGDNVEADHHKGMAVRYFDGAERHATSAAIYAIWLDTEACVTGSSGLAVPPAEDGRCRKRGPGQPPPALED